MKLELKNLKVHRDMSEETVCFSATIYADGKKAGRVKNEGMGGSNFYYWEDAELGTKIINWAKAQKLKFDFEHLDQIIDDIRADMETARQLSRWARNKSKVYFRIKGDAVGTWHSVSGSLSHPTAALNYLNRVYGDQLEKILTEDNVQECVRL